MTAVFCSRHAVGGMVNVNLNLRYDPQPSEQRAKPGLTDATTTAGVDYPSPNARRAAQNPSAKEYTEGPRTASALAEAAAVGTATESRGKPASPASHEGVFIRQVGRVYGDRGHVAAPAARQTFGQASPFVSNGRIQQQLRAAASDSVEWPSSHGVRIAETCSGSRGVGRGPAPSVVVGGDRLAASNLRSATREYLRSCRPATRTTDTTVQSSASLYTMGRTSNTRPRYEREEMIVYPCLA